jgi:hypothetical protein
LIAFAVSLSNEAIAQTNGNAGSTSPAEGAASPTEGSSASKEGDAAATPAAADAQAEAKHQEATANEAKAQAALPPQPPRAAVAPVPATHEGNAEPEPTAVGGVPLTVEILPGSGYPEPRTRGIVGGSMWLTMHGLQFPYMAPETSRNGVRLAISGSIWDDTSYARLKSGRTDLQKHMTRWFNQGRAVVRFTPSYVTREGWFAMGQVETVANIEQTAISNNLGTADDVFVRAGKWNLFDVTVGRYQGWEIYHYGMGLDLNTLERNGATLPNLAANTQIYGVSTYWDRPAFGVGNYAVHFYPTDYLRFEVLGQIGTQGSNVQATRPVAILDLGYLKVKAGWEYGVSSSQLDGNKGHSRTNGFGGAVQFVWNPYLEGGINGAIGYYDYWIDTGLPKPEDSTTTQSFGGFLNGRVYGPLLVGLGANQTRWNNQLPNGNPQSPQLNGDTDWSTHFQGFGAVQYSFWDKLFFKFVANYARFHYEDIVQVPSHSYTNREWGGRLRMMYLF